MKPSACSTDYGVGLAYQVPDALWEKFQPILGEYQAQQPPKKKAGRPRMEDRQAASAIFYVLLTGGQWGALPRSLGAKSTVHDRLKEWEAAGLFERLWKIALDYYDEALGIEWEWQA